MTNNLSNVKAGDTIWVKQTVLSNSSGLRAFPIKTEAHFLSIDGRNQLSNEPIAFLENPFEAKESKERVVLVRNAVAMTWVKRILIKKVNGLYVCWDRAETIEESKDIIDASAWKYMKELPKLTIEELAEKAGITVDEVREIVNQ